MKFLKVSSIILMSFFFMWAFIPQASAKHHSHHHKHRSTRLSFNLSLGIPSISYTEQTVRPVYEQRTIVQPYPAYYQERMYYPVYQPPVYQEVIIQRPYYPYWGY
jgi:hypothetical protein